MDETLKQRPLIIPVFIPHMGCPHRCLFCDQTAISQTKSTSKSGTELIAQALKIYQPEGHTQNRPVEIAFFGGNFLGLPQDKIKAFLDAAAKWIDKGQADSIRFSTRPDTIDDPKMDLIASFPVKTIEIGAQSMDDRVLAATQRGHSVEDTIQAVERLKQNRYQTGIQLMVGLPGEREQTITLNGTAVCGLAPDFVRIYPTLVLAGSPLAKAFRSGQYQPLTLDDAVERTASLAVRFLKNGIAVIRMGLPADVAADSEQLLAGPFHPAFGHLVYERLYLQTAQKLLNHSSSLETVILRVHPKGISTLRGLKNGNVNKMANCFGLKDLKIVPDNSLNRFEVALGQHCLSILDAA